jgi:large subunit ribosomal protein L18
MNKDAAKRKALRTKHLRIRKRIDGTAERPRLSVYRSERHIYGQLVDDVAGRTLLGVSTLSRELRDSTKERSPVERARLLGEHLAEKAIAAGIKQVVFDRGGRKYTGRIASLADGARSKGLQF